MTGEGLFYAVLFPELGTAPPRPERLLGSEVSNVRGGAGGLRDQSGLVMRVSVKVRELQGSTLVGGEARADNII